MYHAKRRFAVSAFRRKVLFVRRKSYFSFRMTDRKLSQCSQNHLLITLPSQAVLKTNHPYKLSMHTLSPSVVRHSFVMPFRKRDKARDGGVEPIAVATHRSLGTYSFLKLYVHFPCSCSRFLYWLVYPKSKSLKRIMPEAIEAVQQKTSIHPDTQAEIEVFLDEHRKIRQRCCAD